MITKIKEVYYCDFCGKLYFRKHAAIYHEKICDKNPENFRPCLNFCKHMSMKDALIERHYYNDIYNEKGRLLYCSKLDCYLYPPKVEIKGNMLDADKENNPMPKECTLFESDEIFKLKIIK